MILGILGIAVIIIASVLAYRTAKDYERNGIMWAVIVLAVGFGIQIALPLLIGIIYVIYILASGGAAGEIPQISAGWSIIIGIVCLVLSIAAVMLILRHISSIPEDKLFTPPPSPPETFN